MFKKLLFYGCRITIESFVTPGFRVSPVFKVIIAVMLTPAFELNQDSDFLILELRVPFTRTSEFDLYIDGEDFKFYAKPYFLRLTLPGRIVEDGREKAVFNIDKGVFTLRVPKETPGQHFEGLQMLTSLLAPKGARSAKALVEDMEPSPGTTADAPQAEAEEEEEDEEEFDWQVEQTVYTESSAEELRQLQKYGFGNLRSGVFSRLQEALIDVIDVKDPDHSSSAERRKRRQEAETMKFDADHYLADLFEDEPVRSLLRFRPWWRVLPSGPSKHSTAVEFTDSDKEQMRRFSNRSFLLDKQARRATWLGLVDILLAYSYEIRVTEGEHNVESPWNIRKLSGTLCWLETYHSLQDVLVSFGRRVLSYPLHRHFALVLRAMEDTTHIFLTGKACLLRSLLDIHKIFRENDPAYILNDLYITDYCLWIQRVKSKHVASLAESLQKAALKKGDLGLELDELEAAAALVQEEEEESSSEDDSDSSSDSSSSDSTSSSSEGDDNQARQEAHSSVCKAPSSGGITVTKSSSQEHDHYPLQPKPSPTPTHTTTAPALSLIPPIPIPSNHEPLILELGERLEEGLVISVPPPQPKETPPSSNSSADTKSSSSNSSHSAEAAWQRVGEGEKRQGSEPALQLHSHSLERAQTRQPPHTLADGVGRTVPSTLGPNKPLFIIRGEDLDSDDEEDFKDHENEDC